MRGPNERLLGLAVERICGASFAMLESASQSRHEFHTMQISRLYLAQIEEALMRATRSERVSLAQEPGARGCRVNEQQYQPLDHCPTRCSSSASASSRACSG